MNLKTPSATDISRKTVLVRTDYNVPLKEKGSQYVVTEDKRILDSLPLINFLIENEAKIILMSHLGRPQGRPDPKLSLQPVADYLREQQQLPVKFAEQTVGAKAVQAAQNLQAGEILLLENLRFQSEEKNNDAAFAKQLAEMADVYINEAFSTCHRCHASIQAITEYLPVFAGRHLQHEVENLSRIMDKPKHPFVIIIGGAKIASKIEAVQNLHPIAELVMVGGGVANNFLKAEGIETHKSPLEDEIKTENGQTLTYLELAQEIVEKNKTEKVLKDGYIPLPKILTPIDVVAAPDKNSTETEVIDLTTGMADTPDDRDLKYLDIGPRTIKLFTSLILRAATIFWSGPLGVFEKEPFQSGTREIGRAIAKAGAETFIGGGDTMAAMNQFGYADRFDYVSSAGGAALEFLADKKLPGLEPLLINK